MSESSETARRELAAAHRVCVRNDLHEGIDNHLSLRVAGAGDEMLLSPFPLHWSEVTASSLLRVRLSDGALLEGEHEVEQTAWFIHGALQRARGRHRCFMHTHQPWATALACRADGRLEPMHQHLIGLYHDIAYLDAYEGEVLGEDYGDEIVRALGDRSVLFLANHGVIAGGANVAQAFERLYYLERACRFQVLAQSGGQPLRLIDKAVVEAPSRKADYDAWPHAEKHFAAWLRILEREEPGYAR